MSQKLQAFGRQVRNVQVWSGLFVGSVVFGGGADGTAQEQSRPKSLPVSATRVERPLPNAIDLEGHSCLEIENDFLPTFPSVARAESLNPGGYQPAALQGARPRFVPTTVPILAPRTISNDTDAAVRPVQPIVRSVPEMDVVSPLQLTGSSSQTTEGWMLRSVDQLGLALHADRQRPDDSAGMVLSAVENGARHDLVQVGSVAAWIAPNLTYQPLLFEDARLERYGYASPYFGVQPIRSGVHFASSSILFPWRAWFHRNECESPLAFERPGSCAPTSREVFVPAVTSGMHQR